LIGTMMGKVHLLPGTTFSNVQEKGDLDPEKSAAMTLDEVERWLGEAITGVYHNVEHRSLGVPPIVAWNRAIVQVPPVPDVANPKSFLIDFLPLQRRLVRREGISLHSIHYWSDVLSAWIGERESMVVRFDPRDLSRIYLRAPNGEYLDIPYRDVRRPPISLWEHRLAIRKIREEGKAHIDETTIFRSIEAMRRITEEAMRTTKDARRQHERRLRLVQGGRDPASGDASATEQMESDRESADRAALKPWEKMLPVEEW
jgi:putative transposase